MRKLTGLLLLLLFAARISAQDNALSESSRMLVSLLDSIQKTRSDSVRMTLNHSFHQTLYATIAGDIENFSLPDSLKISKVVSDDGIVSIISWNIQQNSGENHYAGFVVNRRLKSVIPLNIKQSEPVIPEDKIYSNGEWPGGIIYRIITRQYNRETSYTLLVWDGFDRRTSRKYMEALSFDANGKAVFGAPVFKIKEGIRNRIVHEYASSASFSMQYTRQKVILSGVRKSKRNIDDEMIVLDRLIPLNEELEGQHWAYVPAGNTHDAFIYFEGFWTFTRDIAARNKPSAAPGSKRNDKPELDLLPSEKK